MAADACFAANDVPADLHFEIGKTDDIVTPTGMWNASLYALLDLKKSSSLRPCVAVSHGKSGPG
jgi:hypothetical protein